MSSLHDIFAVPSAPAIDRLKHLAGIVTGEDGAAAGDACEAIVDGLANNRIDGKFVKAVKELQFNAVGAASQAMLTALADFDYTPSLSELLRHVAKLKQRSAQAAAFVAAVPVNALNSIDGIKLAASYRDLVAGLAADRLDGKARQAIREILFQASTDNAPAKAILAALPAAAQPPADRKTRLESLAEQNDTAAKFMLRVPVPTFGDSAGSRVADAYEAIVQSLATGKIDGTVRAAIRELQTQAVDFNNAQAKIILAALDDFGLAPAGIYDRNLETPVPRRAEPDFPIPEPT